MDRCCMASTSVESQTPSDPNNPTTPPDYKGGGDIEEDDWQGREKNEKQWLKLQEYEQE